MIHNRGIALIQILLIIGMLSVFALYLNQGAQQQVTMAKLAQDRAQAELFLHSAHNEILLNLLTEKLQYMDRTQEQHNLSNLLEKNMVTKWNFHSQPFALNDYVEVTMQDQGGLLSAHAPHLGRLNLLLTKNGVSLTRTKQIIDSLFDWQDADNMPRDLGIDGLNKPVRNAEIADITELEHIIKLTEQEKSLLYSNLGMYFRGDFNPLTASKEMLSALTEPGIAELIIQSRQRGELNVAKFKELVDLEGEDINFVPTNTIYIKYVVHYKQIKLTHEYVVKMLPYANKFNNPIKVLMERS